MMMGRERGRRKTMKVYDHACRVVWVLFVKSCADTYLCGFEFFGWGVMGDVKSQLIFFV